MKDYIVIHPDDNVAVALQPRNGVPAGHKFALRKIAQNEQIIKYGYPIGHAVETIEEGQLVYHNNIATNLEGILDYSNVSLDDSIRPSYDSEVSPIKSFMGYRRDDGKVGIRNEVWIIPTVGCVNDICRQIVAKFKEKNNIPDGIDSVRFFPHNYGCSQLGEDHENTRLILRDMAVHPNAGGALIVGLGCENNQPKAFMELLGKYDCRRIRMMICQEIEGDEVETGVNILKEICDYAKTFKREPLPISSLKIGLKCRGSDGFSGITANPLLGAFSDWLCSNNGTTVLTEVPEMFGAEVILMQRAANNEVKEKIVSLINNFKQYYLEHGLPVGENPSPGNKAGGISTLEEKALGCTQKSGNTKVCDVIKYGELLRSSGLNLLEAPGNDLVASTALAAAGCQLVLFTTGRGTPFSTFVPTLKISTNTDLYNRKPNWIDFDAGQLLNNKDIHDLLNEFIISVIDIASGKNKTCGEKCDTASFAIFKKGVTL